MRYTFLHVSPHTLYLPQPPTAANSYSLFIVSNASLLPPPHLDALYIDISKRVSIQSAESCKWDTILGQLREYPHLVTTTVDEVSIKLPSTHLVKNPN